MIVFMNWYKKSMGLWEDIEGYGPEGNKLPALEELKQIHPNINEKSMQDKLLGDFYRRNYFVNRFGWSVPTKQAIEKLKKFIGTDRVLEIGAGYGLWAKLMQDANIPVTAIDSLKGTGWYSPKNREPYTTVEHLQHDEALQKYPSHEILMFSWPPYNDAMAYESLKNFKGDKLIYIGEGQGGCTGDEQFCNLIHTEWQEVATVDVPRWRGIHDYIMLFVRK